MDWPGAQDARRGFEAFVADSSERLLKTGYLIVWDLGLAEDLVQETFVKVARQWPRAEAMDHPLAYARRVLVNLAIDDQRRRSRRGDLLSRDGEPADAADPLATRAAVTVELQDALVRALATLPSRQRATLVLRYWEDLSEAEVAAVMGCSVGTVKTQIWRGLGRMRQVLTPTG